MEVNAKNINNTSEGRKDIKYTPRWHEVDAF